MKYELLYSDTIESPTGTTLYRIRACRGVRPEVPKGTLGGYVQNRDNLSSAGSSWIYDGAQVYGNAAVHGDAEVYDSARVHGGAAVYDSARVHGNAEVCGNAEVYGCASLYEYVMVGGNARVHDRAVICDYARVHDSAVVCGSAIVCDNARVHDSAVVCGDATVNGLAEVCGGAEVRSSQDYMVFKNSWSSHRWFTYTASNRQWKVGCFLGSGEALIKKAYADSERSGRCYEAIVRAAEAIDAVTGRQASRRNGGIILL